MENTTAIPRTDPVLVLRYSHPRPEQPSSHRSTHRALTILADTGCRTSLVPL